VAAVAKRINGHAVLTLVRSSAASSAWREVAAPFLTGEAIPQGVRNLDMCSIAGRLRWEGHTSDIIEAVLAEVNRTRCIPPEHPRKIQKIAEWVSIALFAAPGVGKSTETILAGTYGTVRI